MKKIDSEFIFALSNPGSESALKSEVEVMKLGWRPSYQRRGFVSFKADVPCSWAALNVRLACARRLCLSLGKSASRAEALEKVAVYLDVSSTPVIHHARYQDRKMVGLMDELPQKPLHEGQCVATLVELAQSEFWTGLHLHAPLLSPDPAGDSGTVMPIQSPSRAWLKLEEALRFFNLHFSERDRVVEVGCAPGGVALALLDRGVSVIGVDPAKMADVVTVFGITERQDTPLDRPWFFHCRKPAALVSKRDLGQGVTWFMSDMNQSPEVVLKECVRFCQMAPSIRGVLITLKLTDLQQIAHRQHAWFQPLEAMGFRTIRLQQLSVHHQECALLALR